VWETYGNTFLAVIWIFVYPALCETLFLIYYGILGSSDDQNLDYVYFLDVMRCSLVAGTNVTEEHVCVFTIGRPRK